MEWKVMGLRIFHVTLASEPTMKSRTSNLSDLCRRDSEYFEGISKRYDLGFTGAWNGEGNGNPLQCSCLENPRDGGAWWAAVYGVAQSQTRLK